MLGFLRLLRLAPEAVRVQAGEKRPEAALLGGVQLYETPPASVHGQSGKTASLYVREYLSP
jgi:hypothetical protein